MFPLKYPLKGLTPTTPRTPVSVEDIGDEFVAELMSKRVMEIDEALLRAMRAKQYGVLTYLDPSSYFKEEPKERSTRPNLKFLQRMLTNTVNTNEARNRDPDKRENSRYTDRERGRERGKDDDQRRHSAGPIKRGRGSFSSHMDDPLSGRSPPQRPCNTQSLSPPSPHTSHCTTSNTSPISLTSISGPSSPSPHPVKRTKEHTSDDDEERKRRKKKKREKKEKKRKEKAERRDKKRSKSKQAGVVVID